MSYKGIKALLLLVIGTVLLSALLTPVVYSTLAFVFQDFPWPFSRVFDRVAMAAALLMVVLYWHEFNLSELRRYWTSATRGQAARQVGLGLIISAGTALAVLTLIVGRGELEWVRDPAWRIMRKLPITIAAALLISVIEESFFRVVLLNKIRAYMGSARAVVLCSLCYALVHFITPVKEFPFPHYRWDAGFLYLGEVFDRLFLPGIPSAMFGLFCVGVILSVVILYTRSVFLCIGLHAGWIVALKIALFATESVAGFTFASGPGRRYFLVADARAWVSFLCVVLVLRMLLPRMFPKHS